MSFEGKGNYLRNSKILNYKICQKHFMSYSDYQGRSDVFLLSVALDKKHFIVCRVGYKYCHRLSLVIIDDVLLQTDER